MLKKVKVDDVILLILSIIGIIVGVFLIIKYPNISICFTNGKIFGIILIGLGSVSIFWVFYKVNKKIRKKE